jgi:hypothetical protein
MLLKLLPEQVAKNWETFKDAIEASLPPVVGQASDRMNNILKSALIGKVECWVSFQNEDGLRKIDALILTTFTGDDISGTKNLLIYTFYGYGELSQKSWEEGCVAIFKYAKSRGCCRVIAYSDKDSIISGIKRMGGNTDYTFISVPLE